jgi:hypothetical protein
VTIAVGRVRQISDDDNQVGLQAAVAVPRAQGRGRARGGAGVRPKAADVPEAGAEDDRFVLVLMLHALIQESVIFSGGIMMELCKFGVLNIQGCRES